MTEIPVTADGGRLTTLRLEASFDDGTTWQDLQVRPNGTNWATEVTNPATAGHVTLRATATGPGGAQVKQTVTRAYAVQNRPPDARHRSMAAVATAAVWAAAISPGR